MQVFKTMEALVPVAERSRRGPARAQAYTALRDAIVSAQLAPGRQISENELASLLGVSRTPIREALQRLSEERLVAIVPQLGTFVTHISEAGLSDAQFVREALECAAIRGTPRRAPNPARPPPEALFRPQAAPPEANASAPSSPPAH